MITFHAISDWSVIDKYVKARPTCQFVLIATHDDMFSLFHRTRANTMIHNWESHKTILQAIVSCRDSLKNFKDLDPSFVRLLWISGRYDEIDVNKHILNSSERLESQLRIREYNLLDEDEMMHFALTAGRLE